MLIDGVSSGSTVTCTVNDQVIVKSVSTTQFKLSRIKYDGTAQVGGSSVVRSARTADTILAAGDNGTLIDITSGTFSQTFTAAATLGSGWFCYIRNSGTGDITLDPNSTETIDALATYVMYGGETRLVQCDGSGFNSVVLSPFYRAFTTTGTFTKPPGYSYFKGLLWGAGGSGGKTNHGTFGGGGGGGGACLPIEIKASVVGTTETVTIGAGGAAKSSQSLGAVGGNSTFGSLCTSYGGGGGGYDFDTSTDGSGGGGGGALSAGLTPTTSAPGVGGNPGGGSATANDGLGGSKGEISGTSGWGGAGGAGGGQNNAPASVYGGGGGGPGRGNPGGASVFGGAGSAGVATTAAAAGTQPGGGGGGTRTGISGAGGNGELRIWGLA